MPPRFDGLGAVLGSLVAQGAPVVLTLPRSYRRFPDWDGVAPAVPAGVVVRRADVDAGPGLKYLGACAVAAPDQPVIACDDDWLYGAGWVDALAAADDGESVVCASSFPVGRIDPAAGAGTVVQGFSGVLFRPRQIGAAFREIPAAAFAADDIWFSAAFAASGARVRQVDLPRGVLTPAGNAAAALQDAVIDGRNRAEVYRDTVRLIRARFDLWSGA